jgi:outer membrane protein assembly factor BamB
LEKGGEVLYQGEVVEHIEKQGCRLYLSTRAGFVYCIDGQERQSIWSFQAQDELESPPYLGKENIYVYDKNSVLYCLDKEGKLRWKKELDENISTAVGENAEIIFFGTEEGVLIALNKKDGQESWRFKADQTIRSTPVVGEGMIIFGCDDHHLYFLDKKGGLVDKFPTGDKIKSTPLLDRKSLYFGSDDLNFYSLDFKRRRARWKVKIGCKVSGSPLIYKKRILFLCLDGILFCLDKGNGTILWWRAIPSRSYYQLTRVDEKVLVTSLSSLLVSFDIRTGEKVGEFDSGEEIQSNPLWIEPDVLISLYDYRKKKGSLVYLKKLVDVNLNASKDSPQFIGEELEFEASPTGFFKPEFEFILNRLDQVCFHLPLFLLTSVWERKIVQEMSSKETWRWYPEMAGLYLVELHAEDEKEKGQTRIPFMVIKEKPQVSILSSQKSPQRKNQEVVFQATYRGLKTPEFEFYLSRLKGMDFNPSFFYFTMEWEKDIVQEKSEKNTWTWVEETPGVFVITVKATDEAEETQSMVPFIIEKEMDKDAITRILSLVRWIKMCILP